MVTSQYSRLHASQAGFSYGRSLLMNPQFLHLPLLDAPSGGEAFSIASGNSLLSTTLYAPGWYDYGGVVAGSIGPSASTGVDTQNFTSDFGFGTNGVSISANSGRAKGLVVPIPHMRALAGKRVRLRVAYVCKTSAGDSGLQVNLTGRVCRMVKADANLPNFGSAGVEDLFFSSQQCEGSTRTANTCSGIGHVISVTPTKTTSNAYIQEAAFDTYAPYNGATGEFSAKSAYRKGRPSSFNRLWDSFTSAVVMGTNPEGRLLCDVTNSAYGNGKGGGGIANADSKHQLFFLDYDTSVAGGPWLNDKFVPLYSSDDSLSPGVLKTVDVVVDLPAAAHSDFPASDYVNGMGFLQILSHSGNTAYGGTNTTDILYCDLECLDDSSSGASLGAGVQPTSAYGSAIGAGGYLPHYLVAYPLYVPHRMLISPVEFSQIGHSGKILEQWNMQLNPGTIPSYSPSCAKYQLENGHWAAALHPPAGSVFLRSMIHHASWLEGLIFEVSHWTPNHMTETERGTGGQRLSRCHLSINSYMMDPTSGPQPMFWDQVPALRNVIGLGSVGNTSTTQPQNQADFELGGSGTLVFHLQGDAHLLSGIVADFLVDPRAAHAGATFRPQHIER